MKKILLCLALFCLATGPISCGDSNTDDGTEQGGGGNGGDGGGTGPEPEPGNPEITPEQHKAKLETIGKEVAAQFNPEDSKAAIESLTALEELLAFDDEDVAPSPAPKTYAVATAKSLAAVAAGPDVHALTSLIVRATTTEKYTLDEWAGDYVIEDGEPVKKGELANQYRLTWADAAGTQSEALFTYSAGGVEYTRVDGYAIVIPQDWNLSLKVAGHEELSVVGKSNVSADGLTLAPEVTVTLNGGYVAAAKVNADPKQVTANASFTKNGTQIVDAYAKMVCDGLTDPDNWIVEEEYDWNGDGVIDEDVAAQALSFFEVDALGLDAVDNRILELLAVQFGGRPVGLTTLASALSEDTDTLEDVYEPYLMQQGLLVRTPKGRICTERAYDHLGIKVPSSS